MNYYDKKYFDWQKNVGAFSGEADLFKFKNHIKETDNVIDFGCGGGYILKNLSCKNKIGIDINPEARKEARENGIETVETIEEIEDDFADTIISNHALEHVICPYKILQSLITKLKEDGKIIFVVPHQRATQKFKEDDIDNHLFTWNPLTLGNLFKTAGYKVEKVEAILNKWPRHFRLFRKLLGRKGFHIVCKIYAFLCIFWNRYEIRIIASKR